MRLLSSFLLDPSNPASKERRTCAPCRVSVAKSREKLKGKKRKALQPLDPNVPAKKRPLQPAKTLLARPEPPVPQPELLIRVPTPPPILPPPRPEPSIRVHAPPPILAPPPQPDPPIRIPTPPPPGFLPPDQWRWVQNVHQEMAAIKMEACSRCKEFWFAMDLKDTVCHSCYLRDKRGQTPFLMSADNEMDPGDVPVHLPVLTQVEEMIIARSHVQMLVHRYRGHQYHYSGHCVSFMQSTIKTVSVLPNLPSELDIVLLRPSDQVMESDPRYRQQFRADFRVRRGHVLAWLRYLTANHPDYRYITISPDRVRTLPVDGDISSSIASIIDDHDMGAEPFDS